MSIHNLRYNIQLIIIATGNKEMFEKFQDVGASNNYVRVIVTSAVMAFYAVYIVTQTSSLRRSRDLDKSNNFRQMQELTNDYYSVIKLHNIFHIAYKAIEFSTNKKEPTITFRITILERQRGSH